MVTSQELKEVRLRLRLSQRDVGAAIGMSGFTVSRAETNMDLVQFSTKQRLDGWYRRVTAPVEAKAPTNGTPAPAPAPALVATKSPAALLEATVPAWQDSWSDSVKAAWLTCIGNIAKAIEIANHAKMVASKPEVK